MIRPGSAPMYVRRWPRISASSWTPPSEIRTNLRPSARAMDWPRLVLPTPGGPTKQRIGSRAVAVGRSRAGRARRRGRLAADASLGASAACAVALLAQLLDRQVLEDAVLDLLEVVVVLVQDCARPSARRCRPPSSLLQGRLAIQSR